MKGSRLLIAGLGALAIIAIAVVVVALGTDSGDEEAGEIVSVPSSYDEFVEQVESEPELTTRVTVAPDEKSFVVEETTGASYTIELESGEADSLVETLKAGDVEVLTSDK